MKVLESPQILIYTGQLLLFWQSRGISRVLEQTQICSKLLILRVGWDRNLKVWNSRTCLLPEKLLVMSNQKVPVKAESSQPCDCMGSDRGSSSQHGILHSLSRSTKERRSPSRKSFIWKRHGEHREGMSSCNRAVHHLGRWGRCSGVWKGKGQKLFSILSSLLMTETGTWADICQIWSFLHCIPENCTWPALDWSPVESRRKKCKKGNVMVWFSWLEDDTTEVYPCFMPLVLLGLGDFFDETFV